MPNLAKPRRRQHTKTSGNIAEHMQILYSQYLIFINILYRYSVYAYDLSTVIFLTSTAASVVYCSYTVTKTHVLLGSRPKWWAIYILFEHKLPCLCGRIWTNWNVENSVFRQILILSETSSYPLDEVEPNKTFPALNSRANHQIRLGLQIVAWICITITYVVYFLAKNSHVSFHL